MKAVMRVLKLWVAAMAGAGAACALIGLYQDSYGSLQAYCAYLQEGHWVDGRIGCIIDLVFAAGTMAFLSTMKEPA
jgi:hypothetical protein